MSLKSKVIQFVVLFALPCFVTAQSTSNDRLPQVQGSADVVGTEVKLSHKLVPGGTNFRAAIKLNIAEGWHINAHLPTLDYLIGTEISIQQQHGITLQNTSYPKPQKINFGFAEEAIAVYEEEISVFATFAVPDTLSPGDYSLNGSLHVQACEDQICLSPATIDFNIPIQVISEGEEAVTNNEGLFQRYNSKTNPVVSNYSENGANKIAAMIEQQGLFWAFIGIFFIGLALNLTPCVYPMLSVTVSLFGKDKDSDGIVYSFAMASAYVIGIAIMYSILGVVAAYSGSLFGSWLQSPWVTGSIGILIFGLALSMFGFYELQPPHWMRQKLSGMQGTTGAIGHFLSGMFVGIFAAPCIGPPVVALLAFVGSQGDPIFGFFSFFILSMGLGLPYLLLGTFSGILSRLPQSGSWMVWVKKIFGVVLIGVAVFYMTLAFNSSYAIPAISAVLIAGGLYLGFIEGTNNGTKIFQYLKWGIGAFSIIIGLLFIQNMQKPAVEWDSYAPQKMQKAKASDKAIILDFYADWCIPCHEMEQVTYTDPDVISATSKFKKLKVDLTNYESARSKSLRKKYDIASLPTIIFIGKDGREIKKARITGFRGPEEFVQIINKYVNNGF